MNTVSGWDKLLISHSQFNVQHKCQCQLIIVFLFILFFLTRNNPSIYYYTNDMVLTTESPKDREQKIIMEADAVSTSPIIPVPEEGQKSPEVKTENNDLSNHTQPPPSSHHTQVEIDGDDLSRLLFDPLHLIPLKKSPEEIAPFVKKVRWFYEEQNQLIDDLTTPVDQEGRRTPSYLKKQRRRRKTAIYGSLMANMVLVSLEMIAAIASGSLSVLATMSDAIMDLVSGAIIIFTNHLSRSVTKDSVYRYPIGKARFETVGVIIFGTLMSTVSLQIIIHSITSLVKTPRETPDLDAVSISLIAVAILTKFCLYLYCRLIPVPTVQVLAQDHRNDIVLNTTGVCMGILADRLDVAVLDPIGAIFVALVMFRTWTTTILHQGQLIAGKTADINFLKRVTYLAMTHDDKIIYVESVRAYHCGTKVIVEVDIVLAPEMTLQVAHDLGESLQGKLEMLPKVERAFVHCDYNFTHEPEHQMKNREGSWGSIS